MKRIISLFMVVLLLIIGVSGCNGGKDGPVKSFNQQELWEFLGKHPRYLSEWGADDCALVFDNGDDLTFDYSVYMGEEYNFYFTELISFNKEEENLYKLEYKNPYPEQFENAIFYIDLSSKNKDAFYFGMYYDGSLDYVEVFGDTGLTADELFKALSKHERWLDVDADMYGGYFIQVHDKDQFSLGLLNSGFGLVGTISNVKYHGYMHYTLTVDYPGYEGDEMTDPYDPYTVDYYMYYNPFSETFIVELYEEVVEFAPEVGLTEKELFSALSKYEKWLEVDDDIYSGYFIKAYDKNKFDLGLSNSGFWIQGTIASIKYIGQMTYSMVVDYPGYEGDEMTDPYDPYTVTYTVYYNPNNEVLKIELDEKSVEFAPDVGLTQEQVIEELSKYASWSAIPSSAKEYFIKVYDKNVFELGLKQSGFWIQGTIASIKYNGEMYYTLTVDFPGFEGNEMTDPYDPYTAEFALYFYPNNEVLIMGLYEEVVEFAPDKK